MGRLKLTVNEEKTRICRVPDGEFDFLGYSFGRMYSARTGQARLGYRPSKKSIKRTTTVANGRDGWTAAVPICPAWDAHAFKAVICRSTGRGVGSSHRPADQ